jgi:hypothetical protein
MGPKLRAKCDHGTGGRGLIDHALEDRRVIRPPHGDLWKAVISFDVLWTDTTAEAQLERAGKTPL